MPNDQSYFANKDCPCFPCHRGGDRENFNCLFCYCPLYLLGDKCGGAFRWLANGVKDCSDCLYPHRRENYEEIVSRFQEIAAAMPREWE